jgi:hypothetical protein
VHVFTPAVRVSLLRHTQNTSDTYSSKSLRPTAENDPSSRVILQVRKHMENDNSCSQGQPRASPTSVVVKPDSNIKSGRRCFTTPRTAHTSVHSLDTWKHYLRHTVPQGIHPDQSFAIKLFGRTHVDATHGRSDCSLAILDNARSLICCAHLKTLSCGGERAGV